MESELPRKKLLFNLEIHVRGGPMVEWLEVKIVDNLAYIYELAKEGVIIPFESEYELVDWLGMNYTQSFMLSDDTYALIRAEPEVELQIRDLLWPYNGEYD